MVSDLANNNTMRVLKLFACVSLSGCKILFFSARKFFAIALFSMAMVGCELLSNQASILTDTKPIPTEPYVKGIPENVLPKPVEIKPQKSLEQNSLDINQSMLPAVAALVLAANKNIEMGDLASAVTTMERALRIDSRNPSLMYKLAKIRLKQSKPRLAEDLAKKAALLSVDNQLLKKQSWLLISRARKQQKNHLGAKKAMLKANSL